VHGEHLAGFGKFVDMASMVWAAFEFPVSLREAGLHQFISAGFADEIAVEDLGGALELVEDSDCEVCQICLLIERLRS
jgi:hypothetical protein